MWGEGIQNSIEEAVCAQTANRLTFCFCARILQAGAENHSQGIKERNRDCFEMEVKNLHLKR